MLAKVARKCCFLKAMKFARPLIKTEAASTKGSVASLCLELDFLTPLI
jgi:hypothetical protein